jgi:hypothetical protein
MAVMGRALLVALVVTQVSCSLVLVQRPPPGGGRCARVAGLGWPVTDTVIAGAALAFGFYRALDPLCDTATPCRSGERAFSALGFGALVAVPFAISAYAGYRWRHVCRDREPPPPRPEVEVINPEAEPGI